METKKKTMSPWLKRSLLIICFLLYVAGCSSIIMLCKSVSSTNLGVQLVKAMYEFSTPDELVEKQMLVKALLTDSEFERLTVDEPLRAVNAYQKFHYSASKVQIIQSAPGFVAYHLINSSIDPDIVWVLQYDVDAGGKLSNIREYKAGFVRDGGFFA